MELWRHLWDGLHQPLFTVIGAPISVLKLLQALFVLLVVHLIASAISRRTEHALKAKGQVTEYAAVMIARWVKVALWVVGIFIAADLVGIKLTSFSIFAGALGLGIGFGLQTLINNFVSGMLLLIERTMKVGDIVTVAGEIGKVIHISARATVIETPRGAVIVIPNTQFINAPVTNWTASGQAVRVHIPITITQTDDLKAVETLLLEVAQSHPQVLNDPPPQIWLNKIGDTIGFELLVWVSDPMDRARQVQSDLNHALYHVLRERDIAVRG